MNWKVELTLLRKDFEVVHGSLRKDFETGLAGVRKDLESSVALLRKDQELTTERLERKIAEGDNRLLVRINRILWSVAKLPDNLQAEFAPFTPDQ